MTLVKKYDWAVVRGISTDEKRADACVEIILAKLTKPAS